MSIEATVFGSVPPVSEGFACQPDLRTAARLSI
jgi:hypothetical protein